MRTLTNSGVPAAAPVPPKPWRAVTDRFPGIVLVGALAAVAIALGKIAWFESTGISALTLAIALGMIVGNTLYPRIARAGAFPRIEQYICAVLVDGHTAFRARSQDGNAHRRRQLDLRRRGRHGHGTGRARPR